MSKKNFFHRLSDITHIHHRAAFTDVEKHTAGKKNPFLKLAEERFSCREFSKSPVSDADIDRILEAARVAPTAVNKQPVHIWVVKDPALREKMKEATKYTFDAPVIFVVACREADAWVRSLDGKNGAETDAAIVGTHLMLQVADIGLGTTWVGSFDPKKIGELIPAIAEGGWFPVALFPVGHIVGAPSTRHAERKDKEAIATIL